MDAPYALDAHDAPTALPIVKTHPELMASLGEADRVRHEVKVSTLTSLDVPSLCTRLETAADPAMLWPIHQEFHRRAIPPVLRGPRHHQGRQGDFLDFAADVQHLQLHYPAHKPRNRLICAIWKLRPGTPDWWNLLRRQFEQPSHSTRTVSIAFTLDSQMRRCLRTIQTAENRRLFFDLHGRRFGELLDALTRDIAERPDKSGQMTPEIIASRRARMFRAHKLMSASYRETKSVWAAMTGENPSLATIRQHVVMAEPAFKRLRARWAADSDNADSV